MMEKKLDGNAAAGILQSIFPFEMTLVQATCTACGTTNLLGATVSYMHGMGTVVRCPGCDNALIRIALVKGRCFLDMRGVRVLQIDTEVDRRSEMTPRRSLPSRGGSRKPSQSSKSNVLSSGRSLAIS